MDRFEVLFYQEHDGECPALAFLKGLPPKVRGKVEKWLEKLGEYGPNLPRPYADTLRGKIRELRIVFASHHYRFLYFFHGRYIVVTQGFLKKTSQVPEDEIKRAERRMADFLYRLEKGEIEL